MVDNAIEVIVSNSLHCTLKWPSSDRELNVGQYPNALHALNDCLGLGKPRQMPITQYTDSSAN